MIIINMQLNEITIIYEIRVITIHQYIYLQMYLKGSDGRNGRHVTKEEEREGALTNSKHNWLGTSGDHPLIHRRRSLPASYWI